jgi:hypothetical protein
MPPLKAPRANLLIDPKDDIKHPHGPLADRKKNLLKPGITVRKIRQPSDLSEARVKEMKALIRAGMGKPGLGLNFGGETQARHERWLAISDGWFVGALDWDEEKWAKVGSFEYGRMRQFDGKGDLLDETTDGNVTDGGTVLFGLVVVVLVLCGWRTGKRTRKWAC